MNVIKILLDDFESWSDYFMTKKELNIQSNTYKKRRCGMIANETLSTRDQNDTPLQL